MSKLTDNTNRIQGLIAEIEGLPKDRYEEGIIAGGAKFKGLVERTITEITAEDLAGVTQIGASAFREYSQLISITFPDSIKYIRDYAFYLCVGLTSITIPNSVISIGNSSFYGCSGITSINILNGIRQIGRDTFRGCVGLTSIIIPDSVTDIPAYAFYGCKSLENVIIGSGIKSFGNGVFSGGCEALKSITNKALTPPKIQSNTFSGVPADCIFYVPAESVEAYKTATNWSALADRIFAIEE